jgi:hypothetical protein
VELNLYIILKIFLFMEYKKHISDESQWFLAAVVSFLVSILLIDYRIQVTSVLFLSLSIVSLLKYFIIKRPENILTRRVLAIYSKLNR